MMDSENVEGNWATFQGKTSYFVTKKNMKTLQHYIEVLLIFSRVNGN